MGGKTVRVGMQGERGSFTEEALIKFFGPRVEVVTFRSLAEAFNSLEACGVDYSIVPVENSLVGTVGETYDLLLVHNVYIVGEVVLRITHYLLGLEDSGIEKIKTVWSHPQALDQCRSFIEKHKLEAVPRSNTAAAARELSSIKDETVGVIASKRAADIYKLKVLVEGVEDNPNNYTRFFVLGKKLHEPTGRDKTSIMFSAYHEPGSLYSCLEVFAKRRINLTKIESRPTKMKPWEYYFYLDFEGHIEDSVCREAIRELSKRVLFLKILGSYPVAEERDV